MLEQAVTTTSNTYNRPPETEVEPTPPFVAMNKLRAMRMTLDVTITELIGRLQPYVDDTKTRADVNDASKDIMAGDSALERVIGSEALFVAELNERLRELMTDLRL